MDYLQLFMAIYGYSQLLLVICKYFTLGYFWLILVTFGYFSLFHLRLFSVIISFFDYSMFFFAIISYFSLYYL
jgi:hypothetical protein